MECAFIFWSAMKPEAQAAWVQAVGSVLAIFVAVAVPWQQHRAAIKRQQATEDSRARALALANLNLFRNWHYSIQGALDAFGQAPKPLTFNNWKHIQGIIEVNPTDTALMDRSDGFGPASGIVQDFLYHAQLAWFATDNAILSDGDETHEQAFFEHANAAALKLSQAIRILEKLAGAGAKNHYRKI